MGVISTLTLVLVVAVVLNSIELSWQSGMGGQSSGRQEPSNLSTYLADTPPPTLQKVRYPSDPPPELAKLMGRSGERQYTEFNDRTVLLKSGSMIVGWLQRRNVVNAPTNSPLVDKDSKEEVTYAANLRDTIKAAPYKELFGIGCDVPESTQFYDAPRSFWFPGEGCSQN